MASTIGIKIANGEFYSIMEENAEAKKRLILTTVHDGQQSMQIDLYRSYAKTMADALYIGSIVVENIKPKLMGSPSVELIISSTYDGVISAYATDLDETSPGERFHLSVSLRSLEDDARDTDIPDYELEDIEAETTDAPPPGLYEKEPERRRRRSLPWIILGILGLLIALILVWFFLLRPKPAREAPRGASIVREAPPAQAPSSSPITTARPPAPPPPPPARPVTPPEPPIEPAAAAESPIEPVEPPIEPAAIAESSIEPAAEDLPEEDFQVPVIEAPPPEARPATGRARNRPPAPVSSYQVPSVIPRGGVAYTIRWGDTLWEISEAFYRNPWLYTRIAGHNNIRNPDLIISGTLIRIPPGN